MIEKQLFVEVHMIEPPSDHYVLPVNKLDSLASELEAMAEYDDGDVLILKPVMLTEKEFEDLPEFQGF